MPVNVFGAGAVQSAYVAYSEISLTTANNPYQLYWPSSYYDTNQLLTAIMDVNFSGTNIIAPVNLATTGVNIIGTYVNGTAGVGATLTYTATGTQSVDSTVLTLGARVLVKDQSTASQNGIYTVTNAGGTGVSVVLTRATDYDLPTEISQGDYIFVQAGTVNINTTWLQTAAGPFTIGTTSLTFAITNALVITLPNSTQVSVGQNFIIRNKSAYPFTLTTLNGSQSWTISSGIAYYFYLTDNTTADGLWSNVTYGAGSADIAASELAGNGLISLPLISSSDTLNTNFPNTILTTSTSIGAIYRAQLIVWQGGTGTITLPAPSSPLITTGFYFAITNAGDGPVTITPTSPDKIDKLTIKTILPNESCTIILGTQVTGSYNWWSLGFGNQTFTSSTAISIGLPNSGNVVLSTVQASYNIIEFTGGPITGAVAVTMPRILNEWTISTTGITFSPGGSLTLAITGGTPKNLFENRTHIFFCDGSNNNLYPTPTAVSSDVNITGNVYTDGYFFNDDTTTGINNPTDGVMSFLSNNNDIMDIKSDQVQIHQPIVPWNDTIKTDTFDNLSPTTTTGDTIYDDGTNNVRLAIGTTNQVLTPVAGVPSWQSLSSGFLPTVPINKGGTGQTTATAGFNALSPTTTAGDMIYYNGTNNVRLPIASLVGETLYYNGSAPTWGGYTVLQKVVGTFNTGQTIAIDSALTQDTNITLTITPTYSNSSILVLLSVNACTDLGAATPPVQNWVVLSLGARAIGSIGSFYQTGASTYAPQNISFNLVDPTGSLTPKTYTVRIGPGPNGGNAYINQASSGTIIPSYMTLIELGGS